MSVANGLVYVTTPGGPTPETLTEYDETGPRVGSEVGGGGGPPVVANGIYVGDSGSVNAYAPLHSQVLVPSSGSSVSGTTVLNASAIPGVTVSGVQFELNGGSLSDQVVGTATPTLYGWIAQWDTTTVPNGTYTLQSVATATQFPLASLITVTSPGITVTVNNGGS